MLTNISKLKIGDDVRNIEDALLHKVMGGNIEEITWEYGKFNANNVTSAGTYRIKGERTSKNDNLPFNNTGGGNTIDAILQVLDSSLPNVGDDAMDVCVTQILTLSNRVGGDGNVYIRTANGLTKNSLTWEPWGKLQTNIELGVVSDSYTHDSDNPQNIISDVGLNSIVDNGMYSGIYLPIVGGNSQLTETFVMVVLNNYPVTGGQNKSIMQIKFGLTAVGELEFQKRVKLPGQDWSQWTEMGVKNVAQDAIIGSGVVIEPKVHIESGATIGSNVKIADNTKITVGANKYFDVHVGDEGDEMQTGYLNFKTSLTGMGIKISDAVMINSGFAVQFTDDNKIVFTNIKTGMKAELPLSY